MNNGTKAAIGALALGALFILMSKGRHHEKTATGEKSYASEVVKSNTKLKAPKMSLAAKPDLKQRLAFESELGFVNVPVRKGGKGVTVNVEFSVKHQCEPGDVNIIETEIGAAPKPKLLLTVEPVEGGDPVFSKRLSLEQIKGGFSEAVELPDSGDPRPLGVFICLDGKNEGRCAKKPVQSLAGQYTKDTNGVPYKGKGWDHTPDKIYFFEFLHVQQSTMQVLSTTTPRPEQYQGIVSHYKGHVEGTARPEEIVDNVKRINEKIESMPPEVDKSGVRFVLPYGQSSYCKVRTPTNLTKMHVVKVEDLPKPPPGVGQGKPPKVWSMSEKDKNFQFQAPPTGSGPVPVPRPSGG